MPIYRTKIYQRGSRTHDCNLKLTCFRNNGEKKYVGRERETSILYKKLSEIIGNVLGKTCVNLFLSSRWAYLFICTVNHGIYFINIAEDRL